MLTRRPMFASHSVTRQSDNVAASLSYSPGGGEESHIECDCRVFQGAGRASVTDWGSTDESSEQNELTSPSSSPLSSTLSRLPSLHRTMMSDEDMERQLTANELFQRFQDSDLYVQYRDRQQKDHRERNPSEQKWPDALERAFFYALVKYPPMGRRKILHRNKQRGRNELIAEYLLQSTGVVRTRKQVSSHIQVLKPFVENDARIMYYLAKDENGPVAPAPTHIRTTSAPKKIDTKRSRRATAIKRRSSRSNSNRRSWVPSDLEISCNIVKPLSFTMMSPMNCATANSHSWHSFTETTQGSWQADQQMSNWQMLEDKYPLAVAFAHSQHQCDFLSAKASVALLPERDSSGVVPLLSSTHLNALMLCKVNCPHPGSILKCITRYFEGGQCLQDSTTTENFQFWSTKGNPGGECRVDCGGRFWASRFARLTDSLIDPVDTIKLAEQEAAKYLENLSMVQEFACENIDTGVIQTVLVIFWQFSPSQNREGWTQWSKIILPPRTEPATAMQPRPYYMPNLSISTDYLPNNILYYPLEQDYQQHEQHYNDANNVFEEGMLGNDNYLSHQAPVLPMLRLEDYRDVPELENSMPHRIPSMQIDADIETIAQGQDRSLGSFQPLQGHTPTTSAPFMLNGNGLTVQGFSHRRSTGNAGLHAPTTTEYGFSPPPFPTCANWGMLGTPSPPFYNRAPTNNVLFHNTPENGSSLVLPHMPYTTTMSPKSLYSTSMLHPGSEDLHTLDSAGDIFSLNSPDCV